jgi:hypothetical protein
VACGSVFRWEEKGAVASRGAFALQGEEVTADARSGDDGGEGAMIRLSRKAPTCREQSSPWRDDAEDEEVVRHS